MKIKNKVENQDIAEDQVNSDEIKDQIRSKSESIIDFCTQDHDGITFYYFEKELMGLVYQLACYKQNRIFG